MLADWMAVIKQTPTRRKQPIEDREPVLAAGASIDVSGEMLVRQTPLHGILKKRASSPHWKTDEPPCAIGVKASSWGKLCSQTAMTSKRSGSLMSR